MCILPEGEDRMMVAENLFKEILVGNFPNLGKENWIYKSIKVIGHLPH